MILSVSRRTDIPAFHFDWFLKRLEDKEVLVRNPFNFNQVSKIDLSPENIDCIVFWTKNAKPMLDKLDRLSKYKYYVQFTINPYGKEIENNLPDKKELVRTFQELSTKIGKERTILRYSPILLNEKYTEEYHYKCFEQLMQRLQGYTEQCNISFIEMYKKITVKMKQQGITNIPDETKIRITKKLFEIAKAYDIEVRACGNINPSDCNVKPATCIDTEIVNKITGLQIPYKKDKGQDKQCYCAKSVDIGSYNTCLNGCTYCYANQSNSNTTISKANTYDVNSSFLCSSSHKDDVVTLRKI